MQGKAGSAEIVVCVQDDSKKTCLIAQPSTCHIAKARCSIFGLSGTDAESLPVQVSIARPGALCSPLPAAVLALAHNFTAAQSMQEPLPASLSVLDAHARDAKEHFELARSLFKQVQLSCCHEAALTASWDLSREDLELLAHCPMHRDAATRPQSIL